MPESQGMHSAGTILYVANYSYPGTPPAARPVGSDWTPGAPLGYSGRFQALPELIDCNGVDLRPTDTRVTHLRSDLTAQEKVPGFLDANQLTCRFNYFKALQVALGNLVPGAVYAPRAPYGLGGQTYAHWGIKRWVLLLPDGGAWWFRAYLAGFPVQVPEDDRISLDVNLTITGAPTFLALA